MWRTRKPLTTDMLTRVGGRVVYDQWHSACTSQKNPQCWCLPSVMSAATPNTGATCRLAGNGGALPTRLKRIKRDRVATESSLVSRRHGETRNPHVWRCLIDLGGTVAPNELDEECFMSQLEEAMESKKEAPKRCLHAARHLHLVIGCAIDVARHIRGAKRRLRCHRGNGCCQRECA